MRLGTLAEFPDNTDALRQLSSWGVDVKCFQLSLFQRIKNSLQAVGRGLPLQYFYSFQPELWDWIRHELESGDYDLVHVEHLRGAVFGARIREAFPDGPPVVWDAVDTISWLVEQARARAASRLVRLVAHFELERTRRCEAWLRDRFAAVVVAGTQDQALLEKSGGRAPVAVVPNGVDSSYFSPSSDIEADAETLVFSGKMSFHANVSAVIHFVKKVLPVVWETRPGVRFWVVGAGPPRILHRLSRRSGQGRIRVVGQVPDLRPYLRRAAVAVAPLTYSVGVQNKVLEALSCGIPLVAYPSAVRALGAQPGRDLLVAEDPEGFAENIGRLLESSALRQEMGAAGRRYVASQHDWHQSGRKLESVYRSVLGLSTR